MNVHAAIPLVGFIGHAMLLAAALAWGRSRLARSYALAVAASALWGASSFLIRAEVAAEQDQLLGSLLFGAGASMPLLYYRFVRDFENKTADRWVYASYGFMLIFALLAARGQFPRSVSSENGILVMDRGPFAYPAMLTAVFYWALSIHALALQYRRVRDPLARTRTLYLLVALSLLVCFSVIFNIDERLAEYSLDHIGSVLSGALAAYAILRHKLLEVRFVMRRTIALSIVSGLLGLSYLAVLVFAGWMMRSKDAMVGMAAGATTAIIMTMLLGRMIAFAKEVIDRLFLGDTYLFRQKLARFPDQLTDPLDLEVVSRSLLRLTVEAVGVEHAALLLERPDGFTAQFSVRCDGGEQATVVNIGADDPAVSYLSSEDAPLVWSSESDSLTAKLWPKELKALGYVLLCPLRWGDRLVGVLSLGRKERGDSFSQEDLTLLAAAARGVGALVGNACRHAAARSEANTDELTGLSNHRLFYETLEQTISSATRFGVPFSVIMVDIDFFKTYNDTHGHLAGDAILREVAICISQSVRRIDRAFRYGGEEFAIVIPELGSRDAYKVAERVRRSVETRMDSLETWLTISAGVASWPADAVTAAELVQRADMALYEAKAAGRNCTKSYSRSHRAAMDLAVSNTREDVSLVYALAATVDAKDHYTYGHSKKVSRYAVAIAEVMSLDASTIAVMRDVGLLHDIGKISVPDAVLKKPGPLTKEDWTQLRGHPEVAVAILRHVTRLTECLPAILHHHERMDGQGYPLGLAGSEIPLGARIVAVADAFDAMTSDRPYRPALSTEQALEEMRMCAGRQFDHEVVDALSFVLERNRRPVLHFEKNRVVT